MPKAAPIKDRLAVTDHIADVMHDLFRDVSIDKLLTQPFDALRMATEVARRSGKISTSAARHMHKWLDAVPHAVGSSSESTKDAVSGILRTALASRKRGDLKMDRY